MPKPELSNEELIQLHLEAAHEAIVAGQYAMDGGFFGMGANRAYYACFYAATALLLTRGITRSKHSGVLAAFRYEFIRTRLIESHYSDTYGEAFAARHIVDYDMVGDLTPEEAKKTLANTRAFVARIETYLAKIGE